MQEDVTEGFCRGANDYLVKPVAFAELDVRIARQLRTLDAYRGMRTELEMRRRHEGEIERAAQLAGQAKSTLQALAMERAHIEGATTGERLLAEAEALGDVPIAEAGDGRQK